MPKLVLSTIVDYKYPSIIKLTYNGHNFYSVQLLNFFRPIFSISDINNIYTITTQDGRVIHTDFTSLYANNLNCISHTIDGQRFINALIERNKLNYK